MESKLTARLMRYKCGWRVMEQWEEREHIQTTWIPPDLHPKSRAVVTFPWAPDGHTARHRCGDVTQRWSEEKKMSGETVSKTGEICKSALAPLWAQLDRKTHSDTRGFLASTGCLCGEWHHDRVSAVEACASPTCVSSDVCFNEESGNGMLLHQQRPTS